MMILDRSGSMSGTPIAALKSGALSFLSFFDDTQTEDEMGLITYDHAVTVNYALNHNFVTPMTNAINGLSGTGSTNIEEALDRADGPQGFTDQTNIPGDQRVQQFVVFFTDGQANTFRYLFTRNGVTYDALGYFNALNSGTQWYNQLFNPNVTGTLQSIGIPVLPTGDGLPIGTTKCGQLTTTRWLIFSTHHTMLGHPVRGYSAQYCSIPATALNSNWIWSTAAAMAIDHATELKNKYIRIYTIGLGGVNTTFLGQVASGPEYEYYAPTPAQLEALFNAVAKEIKLRLVE
jgi:hypothetical protein